MIHLDTSFLIDLLAERRQGGGGGATSLLTELADESLWISVHVECELRAGLELGGKRGRDAATLNALLDSLQVAFPDHRFAPTYGRLFAATRRARRKVAAIDLLIATSAVAENAALVTRNRKDFERIPDVEIIGY